MVRHQGPKRRKAALAPDRREFATRAPASLVACARPGRPDRGQLYWHWRGLAWQLWLPVQHNLPSWGERRTGGARYRRTGPTVCEMECGVAQDLLLPAGSRRADFRVLRSNDLTKRPNSSLPLEALRGKRAVACWSSCVVARRRAIEGAIRLAPGVGRMEAWRGHSLFQFGRHCWLAQRCIDARKLAAFAHGWANNGQRAYPCRCG